jgi:hypothetical protein
LSAISASGDLWIQVLGEGDAASGMGKKATPCAYLSFIVKVFVEWEPLIAPDLVFSAKLVRHFRAVRVGFERPDLRPVSVDLAQVNFTLRDCAAAFFAAMWLSRWSYFFADVRNHKCPRRF